MGIIDFSNYTSNNLTFTRNPFGFINVIKDKYDGVTLDEQGNISDSDLLSELKKELKKNNIELIIDNTLNHGLKRYKLLPDTLNTFKDKFIDANNKIKNKTMFKVLSII